jgi:DNA-binding NarL/FixJ family response regulator
MVRAGLHKLLLGTEFSIQGEAEDPDQLLELLRSLQADPPLVILLDVRLRSHDGLAALELVRKQHSTIPVVMFSGYNNPTYLARAAALGAYEYLDKNCSRSRLLETLTSAANGRPASEHGNLRQTRRDMHRRRDFLDTETPLTNREYQVVRHIGMGLSNREIGHSLGISVETVKEHVQNLLRKVEVKDRTQAAVWAVRKGMI